METHMASKAKDSADIRLSIAQNRSQAKPEDYLVNTTQMRNLHHQKSLGLFVAFAGLLLAPSFPVFASTIANFAGTGAKGFSGDGGPATKAELNGPTGVAVAPDGSLFICDTANQRIRKVSPSGIISTFAGTGQPGWSGDGGPATAAKLNEPYEVRFDAAGNVYWVERLSATVRKWDAKTHLVTTIAGSGTP